MGRVCHPIGLPAGYHAVPRGQAWEALPVDGRNVAPRGAAWSGGARPTGYHADPSVQDRTLGPSSGRRTSRSIEQPGEIARTFLLVNPAASLRWRRRRSVGRTSWPVSRILCTGRLAASRPAVIHLGLPSPAGSSGLPAGIGRATLDRLRSAPYPARLLALLQVGFTEPSRSPGTLVVSYTTVSPLPRSRGAVGFLWHCPAGHPGLPLATTLP